MFTGDLFIYLFRLNISTLYNKLVIIYPNLIESVYIFRNIYSRTSLNATRRDQTFDSLNLCGLVYIWIRVKGCI